PDEKKTESTDTVNDTTSKMSVPSEPAAKTQNMDAISVAPNLYKMANDSMGIRILNIVYKPGDSSGMHSHPDGVLYVIDGGKSQFTLADGTKQVYDLKAGTAMVSPAGTHSVKNIGTTTTNAVLFEVNRPDKSAAPPDPAMDATKVAPNLYKLIKDTMNIRILMATYKPGTSSAMHAHPDNAIYVVETGKGEFTMKDGTKRTNELTKGLTAIRPAEMHSVKNVGSTTMKVLLVEVNRPQ
ncbi:MAG: cupin domain-containing protein, partial [Ginsengibacter sp.]